MHNFLRLFCFFVILSCSDQKIKPFLKTNGQEIFTLVKKQISFGARHSGSKNIYKNFLWLSQWAKSYSYKISFDQWDDFTNGKRRTMRNLYAVKPSANNSSNFIIIASHYDTKFIQNIPNFIGANDGASSTGLLAHLMKKIAEFPNEWNQSCELRFVFFDGEEAFYQYTDRDGLHGSRFYLAKLVLSGEIKNCRAFILADMVGDRDLLIEFPRNSTKNLVNRSLKIARAYGLEKFFLQGSENILDDHSPFYQQGVPSINFIDFNYGINNSYWHTKSDNLEKLSPQSLEIVGDAMLSFIYQLSKEK